MRLSGVRFLLIDGPNLIRRIHAAIQTGNQQQIIEHTISSTHLSLSRALKQHTPTHVLCAFESAVPTWRHDLFADYKKDRPAMADELVEIFARLQLEITENGIQAIHAAKMEADDVIASAAVKAAAEGASVTILSTDTGQAQLLRHGISQYNHFSQEPVTEETIRQRFSVNATQLNDYFALVGDKSHSLPGVPAVGAKTAARLLADYSSLEEILAAAKDIGGRIGESLIASHDSAMLIKKLLTLRTDVNLGTSLRTFRYTAEQPF